MNSNKSGVIFLSPKACHLLPTWYHDLTRCSCVQLASVPDKLRSVQCHSLTHSLTHSVTYSLQHVLATPQVAWLTHLELTRIMFSKRICYDLFNRRQKCRKMECFESHVYFSKYVAAPASVTKELGPVLVYKVLDPASIFPRWKIISINYRTNIFNCIQ